MDAAPLLEVSDLTKHFRLDRGWLGRGAELVRAVDGVSFAIAPGEVLGLVGESGSGKSTIGRTILRLLDPTGGRIAFEGRDVTRLGRRALKPLRRRMQLVFQDPFGSLNPRMTVESILAAPLRIHEPAMAAAERRERIQHALVRVGLAPHHAARYPHEFSGGQRQRIGIARSLMVHPVFLVADEPVSALDVSIQAQIVNLLLGIKDELGLTILFISHDLAVVAHSSDRIAVLYLGRIVELAPARTLFRTPRHPYTEALLSAAPIPDPTLRRQRIVLKGDLPSPINPPSGCAFRTRCRYALPACAEAVPPLAAVAAGHLSACIRDDLDLAAAGRA
ncbi:MAG: oligopeptide/dipeptide ABC transporter ATP-binding protein [Dongiaceae bacterium]